MAERTEPADAASVQPHRLAALPGDDTLGDGPRGNRLAKPEAAHTGDPTYGRIDPDIQATVEDMDPPGIGERVAWENTLQARRDADARRTPLARRGLLHGSTHAPDHDELLQFLESMHTTQVVLAVVALLALTVGLAALLLATT